MDKVAGNLLAKQTVKWRFDIPWLKHVQNERRYLRNNIKNTLGSPYISNNKIRSSWLNYGKPRMFKVFSILESIFLNCARQILKPLLVPVGIHSTCTVSRPRAEKEESCLHLTTYEHITGCPKDSFGKQDSEKTWKRQGLRNIDTEVTDESKRIGYWYEWYDTPRCHS